MSQPLTPLSKLPQFDPRLVPVIRQDGHMPAVDPQRLSPLALRQRFARPPEWQPEVVRERRFSGRQPALAAVLVGIVTRDEPTILLTRRTAHLSTHSGQVAFPGGKVDVEDAHVAATALREAQEEVGLDPGHVEVLGTLSEYVTGTAFIVTPVVALIDPAHGIVPNPHEVDQVFEVPLAFLMNPAHHRRHAFESEGVRREWFSMPYDDQGQERFIWGATAGMLRNFYRFLSA
ncbi:MAG: CoA pyrophosphatase [Alphaproteobacteria bacterium]|nr:CoA pyrophosphatase [Alphaproteobacteria bacterium]